MKKIEEEKKKQEELSKKKTFVDELSIIPQTNEYHIMFGVPDKISKLKDGVFFDPKKIKLKFEKEQKPIQGIWKDIGKKYYTPRIRSEAEID